MKEKETKNKKTNPVEKPVMVVICLLVALLLVGTIALVILKSRGGKGTEESEKLAAAEVSASASSVLDEEETADVSVVESEGIPVVEEPVVEEPQTIAYEPAAADGTEAAGLIPMTEEMASLSVQPGWNSSGLNSWYTPDQIHCYYMGWQEIDGFKYHFDRGGLIDRGWKLIGGVSCYFDDSGIYHPEQDNSKVLAFTFDDGPSEGTDQILDICEQYGIRVTFFMIGNQAAIGGGVIPRMIQDRCEVGNHSNTHTQMIKVSTDECVQDFATADASIAQWAGVESDVIRFPYGDYTAEEAVAVGKPSIMWSVDSLDWDLKATEPIINLVTSQVTEGDIILMHDMYPTTVESFAYLAPYYLERGYQLVTVRELAAAKGYDLEAGKTYFGFCEEYCADGRVCQ